MFTGGIDDDVWYMNLVGILDSSNYLTLQEALPSVLKHAQDAKPAADGTGLGCSVYGLAREMGKGCASNVNDTVAGLLYLLHVKDCTYIMRMRTQIGTVWETVFDTSTYSTIRQKNRNFI